MPAVVARGDARDGERVDDDDDGGAREENVSTRRDRRGRREETTSEVRDARARGMTSALYGALVIASRDRRDRARGRGGDDDCDCDDVQRRDEKHAARRRMWNCAPFDAPFKRRYERRKTVRSSPVPSRVGARACTKRIADALAMRPFVRPSSGQRASCDDTFPCGSCRRRRRRARDGRCERSVRRSRASVASHRGFGRRRRVSRGLCARVGDSSAFKSLDSRRRCETRTRARRTRCARRTSRRTCVNLESICKTCSASWKTSEERAPIVASGRADGRRGQGQGGETGESTHDGDADEFRRGDEREERRARDRRRRERAAAAHQTGHSRRGGKVDGTRETV